MRRLLGVFLALPLTAMAAEPATTAVTPVLASSGNLSAQLGQMLLGLLLVIGLIFVLAWLLRRVQQHSGMRGNGLIRLLASQAIGPRERLLLVQVGNEQVLLGLTPGQISPLHVLKEPVHLPEAEVASPEFAQRLMEMLGKDQKDPT